MTSKDDLLERLRSALADRYRILRELGSGGMGSVYLAEDLELGRSVAIKILRPEVLLPLGAERFLLEIEVVGRLSHPHIVPIHRKGTADGLVYYEMPYVEGSTLRARLQRDRQLPLDTAFRITTEVARALGHAHAHGVVHRDIKPENILLQGGVAQVTDFGIARAVWALGGKPLTETGMTLGTPSYMSPEQTMASDLDARSDIYSLACVTYEMLAGQPPFTGPDALTIGNQHRSAVPPDVRQLRPSAPPAVAAAIAKALAKHPADRFESAEAFAEALVAAPESAITTAETAPVTAGAMPESGRATGSPPEPPRSIPRARRVVFAAAMLLTLALLGGVAWQFGMRSPGTVVLPHREWVIVAEFEAPADDPGLAEVGRTLVAASFDQSPAFATVPEGQLKRGLELAGRPDSTRMSVETACELAERGEFQAVVAGQIVTSGSGYAVILRALEPKSREPLATERGFAESSEALLASLDESAQRLRRSLGERVRHADSEEPIGSVATPSLEAYRIYARSVRANRKGEPTAALLEEATRIDTSFATAWMDLADALAFERFDRTGAHVALERALRHPDRLTERHRRLAEARLASMDGQPERSLRTYEHMLQIHPDDRGAISSRAYELAGLGDVEGALEEYRREEALSPFGADAGNLWNQAVCLRALGRVEEARALRTRIPGLLGQKAELADAIWSGQWDEAIRLARGQATNPSFPPPDRLLAALNLSLVRAATGRTAAAFDELDLMDEMARRGGQLSPTRLWRFRLTCVSESRRGVPQMLASRATDLPGLLARALYEAKFGNVEAAERLLGQARARPDLELEDFGAFPVLIEAMVDARAERWAQVAERLRAPALQGEPGHVFRGATQPFLCWQVAEAFEHLDQPDSAIVYLERSLPRFGPPEIQLQAAMQSAFTRRKLVLLNAKLGRNEEARRQFEALKEQLDPDDPDAAALLATPRSVIEAGEAVSPTSRL